MASNSDDDKFVAFVVALVLGTAVGAGCNQCGMVPGFAAALAIVAFVASYATLCRI